MNKILFRTAICSAVLFANSTASASCYAVYNSKGKLLYRNTDAPVDMGVHLRHSVPKKYGSGATMIFEAPLGTSCSEISNLRKKSGYHTVNDTEAVLENLARKRSNPRGRLQGRDDQWLADVDFK